MYFQGSFTHSCQSARTFTYAGNHANQNSSGSGWAARGKAGEEGYLNFEQFPYTSLVRTNNVDAQTPDSTGTMTAIVSGIKTDAGVIGVDEDIEHVERYTLAGNEVITALEMAELKEMATGTAI